MICVSISNVSFDSCMLMLEKFQMAELRIDLLSLSTEQLAQVISNSKIPLIATCRPEKCSDKKQLKVLLLACKLSVTYIDIEYEMSIQNKQLLINDAKLNGTKVIISYHNFVETPSVEVLNNIIAECKAIGADLVKIVCMVNSSVDNAKLISLYVTNANIVSFGMGELGKISRIASVYVGAPFTYASIDNSNSTAPGQFSEVDLRKIFEDMKL